MKTRYLISLAALALMMGSCSSEENQESAWEAGTQAIPFSATISNKSETRGLTEDATSQTITAQWEKGDKVALIHDAIVDVMTVDTVTDTGSATITGTLTKFKKGGQVLVVYIGSDSTAMASLKTTLEGQDLETIGIDDVQKAVKGMLATQDGTLETISAAADYRYAYADLKIVRGKATFKNTVTLPSMTAVWKLALTTDSTTVLQARELVMLDEYGMVIVDLGTAAKDTFYLAIMNGSIKYIFMATDANNKEYSCELTLKKALETGYYYKSTLKFISAVTGVSLDKKELPLVVGQTQTLTATVAPDNATDKTVKWASSDAAVATVDSVGKVTAVAAGEAIITVTATNGTDDTSDDKIDSCKVKVTAAAVAVTGVTLSKTELDLIVGGSETLTATVAPTDATDKTVTWKSSDASVATVDANGKVTAVGAGEATITVTTTDGSFTATCTVTVKASEPEPEPVPDPTINPSDNYQNDGDPLS